MAAVIPFKPLKSGPSIIGIGEMVAGDFVDISFGGTGATTAGGARTALGLDGPGIKTLYESEADTNAFDDAAVTKLAGIAANANLYAHPNHSGDVTSTGDGAQVIAAGVVTNAKLATVAAQSLKGRPAAGTGVLSDFTLSSLIDEASPTGGHLLIAEVGGVLKKVDVGNLPFGETNTGSNIGTAGIGIFKQKTGSDLEFKKLNAGSTKISLVDDTGNDEVDVDLVPGNVLTSTLNNDAGWNAYSHPNHSGDVVSVGDGSQTIATGVVTNTKLASVATQTLKGRTVGGTGAPSDFTLGSLTDEAAPTGGTLLLAESGGLLRKIDVSNLLRRVTTSTREGITPALGERLFETDSGRMFVGDGVAAGGAMSSDPSLLSTGLSTAMVYAIASATQVDIGAGRAVVIDKSDPNNPVRVFLKWSAFTLTLTGMATNIFTDVLVQSDGAGGTTFVQSHGGFSSTDYTDRVPLFRAGHRDNANITSVSSRAWPSYGPDCAVRGLVLLIGPQSIDGNNFSAASTDLSLFKTIGSGFRLGTGLDIPSTNPFDTPSAQLNPATFTHVYGDGTPTGISIVPGLTQIDPSKIDDGSGTLATLASSKWQVMTIGLSFGANSVAVKYGQTIYNSQADAEADVPNQPGLTQPDLAGILVRCHLVVKSDATDLSNAAFASFFNQPQGLNLSGGGTGSAGEINTASSVGVGGVSIFKQKNGPDLQFKSINAGSSKISITDDTGNDEVDVDLVPANILTSTLNNDAGWSNYAHPNHSGDVTSSGDGAQTIAAGAVSNAKMANVATATLKGRNTAGTGSPEDLTILGLTEEASPTSGHYLLAEVGGALRRVDVGNLPTGGGGEVNLGGNVGTAGVGLFKTKSGVTLQFKLLNAGSSKISITDDIANDEVDVDLVPGNVLTSTLNNDAGWNAYAHPNHSGDVTSTGDGAQVIAAGAVSLAKMAAMATASFLGRDTAGAGTPEVLSATIARSILNVADGATANSSNATLLARANHTGTQLLSTISDSGALAALATVSTAQIDDEAVSLAKLAHIATASFLGRNTAATGDPEVLSAATARGILNVADGANNYAHPNHSGDVTSTGDGAQVIAAGVVTNAKLADTAAWSIKARNAGTSGVPSDVAVAGLTEEPTPAAGDFLLGWDSAGALRKFDVGDLPTGAGETNTSSNIGTAGVGIFKQKTALDFEFKKLNAGSARVTITDDTGNDEVDVDVVSVATSAGAGDSGKLPQLDSLGELDSSFINKTDVGDSIAFPEYERNKIQSNPGTPADGLGVSDDRYVDETTGDLYVKELGSAISYPKSPDSSSVTYTPSDVGTPNATYHKANVFLPSGTVPSAGFPWVLHTQSGNFIQTAPVATIAENSRLARYLNKGIAVVCIGVTGRDTSATNVLWEPGSAGFDSYATADFFSEKDCIWALQFFKLPANASTYSLDETRVGIDAASSGAHSIAYGPLGKSEHALFTGSDSILDETWQVQAAVLLEMPTWWNGYEGSTGTPIAPHFRDAGNNQATDLDDATDANLKEGSLDFRCRESGAGVASTPIFIAYDEPLSSEDFGRTGTVPNNDPDLVNSIDAAAAIHASWFGYSLVSAISTAQSTNVLDQSILYVQRGKQYQSGSHNAISQESASSTLIDSNAADFVEQLLKPGLWVNKGNIAGQINTVDVVDEAITYAKMQHQSQLTVLGRANGAGTGDVTELTPIQLRRISWDGGAAHSVLAIGAAASIAGTVTVPTNGILVRLGTGTVIGATFSAGSLMYRNVAAGDVSFSQVDDVLKDYGLLKDDATAGPAATDDGPTLGFSLGCLWIDVSNDEAYISLDVSDDAAIWKNITAPATLTYFAEENAVLNSATNGGFQFSFGNGGVGSANGIAVPVACTLRAWSWLSGSATATGTVKVTKNGTAITAAAITGTTVRSKRQTGLSESFAAGDVVNWQTTATGANTAGVHTVSVLLTIDDPL